MTGITNEGLVLACSAIGAGLAVIAGIGPVAMRITFFSWASTCARVNNAISSCSGCSCPSLQQKAGLRL